MKENREEIRRRLLAAGGIWLEPERMVLRDHRPEDLASHHALLSDPDDMYYLPEIQTHSLEESEKDLKESIREIGRPDRRLYFLRMRTENRRAHRRDRLYGASGARGKLVHAGYFSRRKFWGQGCMTEAFREVLRFAFEENGVFRLTTGCDPENRGSERVMIKCGLRKEADMKQKVWMDGRMRDRVEYRMLKTEWEERK